MTGRQAQPGGPAGRFPPIALPRNAAGVARPPHAPFTRPSYPYAILPPDRDHLPWARARGHDTRRRHLCGCLRNTRRPALIKRGSFRNSCPSRPRGVCPFSARRRRPLNRDTARKRNETPETAKTAPPPTAPAAKAARDQPRRCTGAPCGVLRYASSQRLRITSASAREAAPCSARNPSSVSSQAWK